MTSTARRRLAVAGLLVAGLLAGGAVAAGAATPGPSPSAERSGPAADEERTAERDAARADLLTRQRAPGADPEELGAADDAVHALDAQVYDLEQSCAG